jgi:hypothetical protein
MICNMAGADDGPDGAAETDCDFCAKTWASTASSSAIFAEDEAAG